MSHTMGWLELVKTFMWHDMNLNFGKHRERKRQCQFHRPAWMRDASLWSYVILEWIYKARLWNKCYCVQSEVGLIGNHVRGGQANPMISLKLYSSVLCEPCDSQGWVLCWQGVLLVCELCWVLFPRWFFGWLPILLNWAMWVGESILL